jgi:hypothetical protein
MCGNASMAESILSAPYTATSNGSVHHAHSAYKLDASPGGIAREISEAATIDKLAGWLLLGAVNTLFTPLQLGL